MTSTSCKFRQFFFIYKSIWQCSGSVNPYALGLPDQDPAIN
jgi:hypothetical protein